MVLRLSIRNVRALGGGLPNSLVLDRRNAVIGRAASADWCLPDPTLHISARHCEIRFVDIDRLGSARMQGAPEAMVREVIAAHCSAG